MAFVLGGVAAVMFGLGWLTHHVAHKKHQEIKAKAEATKKKEEKGTGGGGGGATTTTTLHYNKTKEPV